MTDCGAPGRKTITYVCNQRGLPDHDRANALVRAGYDVRIFDWSQNSSYIWTITSDKLYQYKVYGDAGGRLSKIFSAFNLIFEVNKTRAVLNVFYGYHNPIFFVTALFCRLRGGVNVSINDSKFDDYDRFVLSDLIKVIVLLPYKYVLAATDRAAMYARYLGRRRTSIYRCAIDTDRVCAQSRAAFSATTYDQRVFVMVARFVKKKNHRTALVAYERYADRNEAPRKLILCGYGELEPDIRHQIAQSTTLSRNVEIRGYVESEHVPSVLGACLALILPSMEEQFGIVVTEALATGIPVILSNICGATDIVVEGETGFILRPFEFERLASCMDALASDEVRWSAMSEKCRGAAQLADVSVFVAEVERVISSESVNVSTRL
jgi:glycosyltransferase involved in cell wall biosynthesis